MEDPVSRLHALPRDEERDSQTRRIALTPWIALVSCDATTDASADVDIFSLAYERGAVAMVGGRTLPSRFLSVG